MSDEELELISISDDDLDAFIDSKLRDKAKQDELNG